MKPMQAGQNAAKTSNDWQKTSYANLIRYVPSGIYYARLRVKGKLIRKSLKTDVLSVGKLRLADFEKQERQRARRRGMQLAHGTDDDGRCHDPSPATSRRQTPR